MAEDILKELYKFVKDFPVGMIPHVVGEEKRAKTVDKGNKSVHFDA